MKNDLRRCTALLAGALLLGALQSEQDDELVSDVAFRYLFKVYGWGFKRPEVFCIAVEGRDPSESLVNRFVDLETPVKKASECSVSTEDGVRDRKTGKPGLWFGIDKAHRKTETLIEIDGGYSQGLGGAAVTLRMKKKDGTWRVFDDVIRSIS